MLDWRALKLLDVQLPSNLMSRPSKMSQVKSGLRLAALILVGFVVAGMFFGGADYLFFPSAHSRWLGLIFLVISTPVMVLTMNRWVKVMAGFLGLAVLNGLLSISTGHVLANPTMPISHLYASSLTLFFALAAILTGKMKDRRLGLVDRISVMAFLCSLAFLISYQTQREAAKSAPLNATAFTLMGISLSCLFAAWAVDHIQRRRRHNASSHHDLGSSVSSPADPV